MTPGTPSLAAIATVDLSAVARGRWIPSDRIDAADTGIGWLPANLSLTPFGTIVTPNPWGSTGDVRLVPDRQARFRTSATGAPTPFDMVLGDILELDGSPWPCCPRGLLRRAVDDLHDEVGIGLRVAFEQEFQIFGAELPKLHPLSVAALRSVDPFAPRLMHALEEAGIEPEVVLAEFGENQLEVTCAPAAPIAAADRAVAIREIAREIARVMGLRASFAPKTAPDAVGNGVHIHMSLVDRKGQPATHDPEGPGQLSGPAARFCAGVLRQLPALTALTAPSPSSYYRLKPNSWSASYTWLAVRDREAGLRICPVTTIGGRKPAEQFNIEYRAADATGNPYVALTAIIRAGLAGLREKLNAPPVVAEHPESMSEERRRALGLRRLPDTLPAAMETLRADRTVMSWCPADFMTAFLGVRGAELARVAGETPEKVCALYRNLY